MAVTAIAAEGATAGTDPQGAAYGTETVRAPSHLGHVVAGSLFGGLLAAVFLVTVALAGSTAHALTRSAPLIFAPAWLGVAILSHEDAAGCWTARAE